MVVPGVVPSYTRCCTEFSVWLNHVLLQVQCTVILGVGLGSAYSYIECCADFSVWLNLVLC